MQLSLLKVTISLRMTSIRRLALFALALSQSTLVGSSSKADDDSGENDSFHALKQASEPIRIELPNELQHKGRGRWPSPDLRDGEFGGNRAAVQRSGDEHAPFALAPLPIARLELFKRQNGSEPPITTTEIAVSTIQVPTSVIPQPSNTEPPISQPRSNLSPTVSTLEPSPTDPPPDSTIEEPFPGISTIAPLPDTSRIESEPLVVSSVTETPPDPTPTETPPEPSPRESSTPSTPSSQPTRSPTAPVTRTSESTLASPSPEVTDEESQVVPGETFSVATEIANESAETTSIVLEPSPTPERPVDVTITDDMGEAVTLSSVTLGATVTTTNVRGRTLITTITPDEALVTSMVLRTTILPDGSPGTVTSFEIITPLRTATDSIATQTREPPSLQNSAPIGVRGSASFGGIIFVSSVVLGSSLVIWLFL